MPDERTPLIQRGASSSAHNPSNFWDFGGSYYQDENIDYHEQFCSLVGIPSSENPQKKRPVPPPNSLYGRVLDGKKSQQTTYLFTAGISNTLLLSQVIIGAAVTALGASESSHILITIFGAMNTIIAGVVAYLKSRGQPMRARMFRDDLERVADEIENSEIMWLGITKRVHGYQDIDIDKAVTVRSEVARLTRLYERAVRSNSMNNPDMYLATGGTGGETALRTRPLPPPPAPAAAPAPSAGAGAGAGLSASAPVLPVTADPDESPATAAPSAPAALPTIVKEEKKDDKKDEDKKDDAKENGEKKEGTSPKEGSSSESSGSGSKGKEGDDAGVKDKKEDEPPADGKGAAEAGSDGAAAVKS